jgi:hypothetical protein
MKTSAQKLFNSVCDTKNYNCFCIKYVDETLLPQKIEYSLGKKTPQKMKGVDATKQWRILNNEPDFYESSPPLTCRATVNPQIGVIVPLITEITSP